ncbi:phosphate acetyltransferase [Pseudostreptobacillus hongkongensis]|uniref:phosphate acetyltransferase n=2 Tax=Pseudostreptobacillus hongkongensis TaxID=1162717 RepID=UPI00082FBBCA|nr:phosphate acetyltransferase [Pseudostreptobacillus hongkongensis]
MSVDLIARIKEAERENKKTVVLPEAEDERVLRAAEQITREGFAKIILVGKDYQVRENAEKLGISLEGVQIIDPMSYEKTPEFIRQFVHLRSKKGITEEQAREIILNDSRFFGAMLVRNCVADGMVAGSNSPTASVLRAAIQVIGPRKGLKTVSSSFVMLTENKEYGENGTLIFSDCGVLPNPTAPQIADIAESAVEKARFIAKIQNPKVALLTYSTKGSAEGEQVTKMREAYKILEERKVDFEFDGELQLDAAIVPEVANQKAKGSSVAGGANILIFPDLCSGNIGYKLVQRFAKAKALGPLIQGLARPVHDLSRGCSVDDIVDVVAITCAEAAEFCEILTL